MIQNIRWQALLNNVREMLHKLNSNKEPIKPNTGGIFSEATPGKLTPNHWKIHKTRFSNKVNKMCHGTVKAGTPTHSSKFLITLKSSLTHQITSQDLG